MRNAFHPKTPWLGDVLEGAVSAIPQGDVGGGVTGELHSLLKNFLLTAISGFSKGLQLIGDVDVATVALMTIGDENVLKSIQIHIKEADPPGPIRCRYSGPLTDFCKREVSPIHLQGGLHVLRYKGGPLDEFQHRFDISQLIHACGMISGQHIQHQNVIFAVAIDIGHIHPHREPAGLSEGLRCHGLKAPFARIDPDSVGCIEVVADIKIGPSIVVQIMKLHG